MSEFTVPESSRAGQRRIDLRRDLSGGHRVGDQRGHRRVELPAAGQRPALVAVFPRTRSNSVT